MKNLGILIYVSLIAAVLTSCDDGGKYYVYDDAVYYSYWTFSFGTVHEKLSDVDPASFQTVEDWLGRDAKHVYFKDRIVDGADPATVKAKKYPLSHDSKDYYYMNAPLHVSSVSAFKVIKHDFEDNIWAKDDKYAFFDSIRIDNVDLPSFKVEDFYLAKDKNRVYRFGRELAGADPATYEESISSGYGTDKNHVWYYGELMDSVDRASFKEDGDNTAHDKWGKIVAGKRVNGSEKDME